MPGRLPSGGALHVVGLGLVLLHVFGNGQDDEGSLGQSSEELRQFRPHLVDVVAVEADELIGRLRVQFGIGGDGSAQGGEILKAELLRDDQHLGFVALDLVEPELVDGSGREVGGGALADEEGVVLVSVGQGPEAGIGAAGGDVRRGEKASRIARRRAGPASGWLRERRP